MTNSSIPTAEMLSGGIITVEVGTPPTTFMIHENLAVARIGFFKGALNGHFKESDTRIVPLPEDQCDTFSCLVHWLYTGTLDLTFTMASKREQKTEESPKEEKLTSEKEDRKNYKASVGSPGHALPVQRLDAGAIPGNRDVLLLNPGRYMAIGLLFKLLVLGEKLQIPDLHKDITQKFVDLRSKDASRSEHEYEASSSTPSEETLEFVYENTTKTSPLRRLVIDLFILTHPSGLLRSSMDNLSGEIVRDISKTIFTFWEGGYDYTKRKRTKYFTTVHRRGGYARRNVE